MNYSRFLEVSGPTEKGQLDTWCRNRGHPTPEAGYNDWWDNSFTASSLRQTHAQYESLTTQAKDLAPGKLLTHAQYESYNKNQARKVELELDCDQENVVVTESLLWMYHNGELTKGERKAYRTVIKHYMIHDQFTEAFPHLGVYK